MSAAVRPSSVAPRAPRPAGFRRGVRSRLGITSAVVALAALGLAVPGGAAGGATTTVTSTTTPIYTFDDEFTGTAGIRPSSKWSFQTGGDGWGNNELEQYTNRTVNSHLDGGGHLAIVARKETYTGSD